MSTKNERREPHMTSSDTTSPILITGATGRHGRTGAHLARRLREAGRSVRALVRRLDERTSPLQALGAEIVVGDLHARASLVPALEGVGLAYFTYPVNGGIVQAAANFAAAARQVGGHPRVVVMSNGASHPESPSHFGRAHWLAEEVLRWAGLDLISLRIASLFYENVPTLHGRSIRFEPITREAWRDELLALAEAHPGGAVNPIMADHISTLGAAAAARRNRPNQTADGAALQRLTGRAPLSFRGFVQKERERFLQAAQEPSTLRSQHK